VSNFFAGDTTTNILASWVLGYLGYMSNGFNVFDRRTWAKV